MIFCVRVKDCGGTAAKRGNTAGLWWRESVKSRKLQRFGKTVEVTMF